MHLLFKRLVVLLVLLAGNLPEYRKLLDGLGIALVEVVYDHIREYFGLVFVEADQVVNDSLRVMLSVEVGPQILYDLLDLLVVCDHVLDFHDGTLLLFEVLALPA